MNEKEICKLEDDACALVDCWTNKNSCDNCPIKRLADKLRETSISRSKKEE